MNPESENLENSGVFTTMHDDTYVDMGDTGPEHATKTRENRPPQESTGQISGQTDPELKTLLDRWHTLPQTIRRQIVRLADSASLALDGVPSDPASDENSHTRNA